MSANAERTMSLSESLPKDLREEYWQVRKIITLTLPLDDGSHTAFTVHWCPRTRLVAYNVALFPAWRTP